MDDEARAGPGRPPGVVPGHPPGVEIAVLLGRVAGLAEGDPERAVLRERAVRLGLPYARQLARRFRDLGESVADLEQVAAIGLLKAIDRYDPSYPGGFYAYATPTIVGEIKRHFRDRGWAVQVPRRYQELRKQISRCRDQLTQLLGRSPTVADVAAHLHLSEEQVVEAMVAANAYRSSPLQAADGEDAGLVERLGVLERGYDAVELRESIGPAVARLAPRDQRIIALRFFHNRSQAQIAGDLGISQMHVSRLLARSLRVLRRILDEG